ncbi:hypothetical protein ACHHYP_08253 [Achlya hypogyna]|uniref:Putative zinc-finger domain-containing protein n=1 Tax=Achlya hypogyna TaxID=1202772 RepID=A0A1V9ZL59_ACHHY|nr:hypothetical protein ACHHYP_08253 [Achlya hypogyna]
MVAEPSVADLRRELAECEQELDLWKVRLSRARKKRNGLPLAPEPEPPTSDVGPNASTTAAHDDPPLLTPVQSPPPQLSPPSTTLAASITTPTASVTTPTASMTPLGLSSPTAPILDEKQLEDRRQLLQKLREEKAKAVRREKIAELEKAAAEALKKQRIAREQLERANQQRTVPPPIRTSRSHSSKRPLSATAPPPRHAKRPFNKPPEKPVDPETMALPKGEELPFECPADLLSHIFHACTRHLLQFNKPISVAQLQVLCEEYFGKEFGIVARACATTEDLTQVLSQYPFLAAAVTGVPDAAVPSLSADDLLVPSVPCDSPEALATFLLGARELVQSVLSTAALLAEPKELPLLDVVKAHTFMAAASPAPTFIELCWPPAADVALAGGRAALVFQHLVAPQETVVSAAAVAKAAEGRSTTPFPVAEASPLLVLRSFRFQPAFAQLFPARSILSNAFSHRVDPMKVLCPFEMHGVCNDHQCAYQHEREYSVAPATALTELGRFHPITADAADDPETAAAAWIASVQQAARSPTDLLFLQKAPSLAKENKPLEAWQAFVEPLVSLRKMEYDMGLGYLDEDEEPLPTPAPSPMAQPSPPAARAPPTDTTDDTAGDDEGDFVALPPADFSSAPSSLRYHTKENLQHAIHDLERQVALNPEDTDAWVSLALMHLDVDVSAQLDDVGMLSSDARLRHVLQALRRRLQTRSADEWPLEKTLHVLSRALEIEANLYHETLWRLYLALYPDDATRQELAQEALRFLPASAPLWRCFLDRCRFESVAVAQVLHYRAIDKLLRHAESGDQSRVVFEMVLRLCATYVGAGQAEAATALLLSLLAPEKADAKPLCFAAFEFDEADYCQLWLVLVHVTAVGEVPDDAIEKTSPLDWVMRPPVVPLAADATEATDAVVALAAGNMPQGTLYDAVLLINYAALAPARLRKALDRLAPVLTAAVAAGPDDDDVALLCHWARHLAGDDASRVPLPTVGYVHLLLSSAEGQLYPRGTTETPGTWVEKQLQIWAETFAGGVFAGVTLLEFAAAEGGVNCVARQLDWLLQRPRVRAELDVPAQHALWSYRLHLEARTGSVESCEGVWTRYLAFAAAEAVPEVSIGAAVAWCLAPSAHSAASKFVLFQQLLAVVPHSLHASLFVRYLAVFTDHPPYMVAFSRVTLSERQRAILKHGVRACLELHPGDARLVGVGVRLELLVAATRASMRKVQALLAASVRRNPVAAAPWTFGLALEVALGKQKAYADVAAWMAPTWTERGLAVGSGRRRCWAGATVLRLASHRLVVLPPSLLALGSLTELDLSRNCLVELPEAFGRAFPRLTRLNLAFNALRRLPDSLGSLRSLELLDVSHNHLTELPLLLGHLSKLETLDVACNLLTGVPPTFGALKAMRHLRVRGNRGVSVDVWRRLLPTCAIDVEETVGCSVCADQRHTQRLNDVLLCPKCIIQAMAPLL